MANIEDLWKKLEKPKPGINNNNFLFANDVIFEEPSFQSGYDSDGMYEHDALEHFDHPTSNPFETSDLIGAADDGAFERGNPIGQEDGYYDDPFAVEGVDQEGPEFDFELKKDKQLSREFSLSQYDVDVKQFKPFRNDSEKVDNVHNPQVTNSNREINDPVSNKNKKSKKLGSLTKVKQESIDVKFCLTSEEDEETDDSVDNVFTNEIYFTVSDVAKKGSDVTKDAAVKQQAAVTNDSVASPEFIQNESKGSNSQNSSEGEQIYDAMGVNSNRSIERETIGEDRKGENSPRFVRRELLRQSSESESVHLYCDCEDCILNQTGDLDCDCDHCNYKREVIENPTYYDDSREVSHDGQRDVKCYCEDCLKHWKNAEYTCTCEDCQKARKPGIDAASVSGNRLVNKCSCEDCVQRNCVQKNGCAIAKGNQSIEKTKNVCEFSESKDCKLNNQTESDMYANHAVVNQGLLDLIPDHEYINFREMGDKEKPLKHQSHTDHGVVLPSDQVKHRSHTDHGVVLTSDQVNSAVDKNAATLSTKLGKEDAVLSQTGSDVASQDRDSARSQDGDSSRSQAGDSSRSHAGDSATSQAGDSVASQEDSLVEEDRACLCEDCTLPPTHHSFITPGYHVDITRLVP